MDKATPPLKLKSNTASGVKDFLRKSLNKDKAIGDLPEDILKKIEEIQEEGKEEEAAIQKKEFDSREERHIKRTKKILDLLLGGKEDDEDSSDEVLAYPTAPETSTESQDNH